MSTLTAPARVTFPRVLHAEWIKLRSVPSTRMTLVASAAVMILLGMLFSSVAGDTGVSAPGPAAQLAGADPLSTALGALNLSQLMVAVVGVLAVATEYTSGLIRTTLAAMGNRTWMLAGKAAVVAGSTAAASAVGVVGAAWLGQAVYAGDAATLALTDPAALQAMAGAVIYLTGVALMGLALGLILRSTAAAIATVVASLMIVPVLIMLLGSSISDAVLPYLPSEAGGVLYSATAAPDAMSWGAALAVLAAWVVGLLATAGFLLHRRDA